MCLILVKLIDIVLIVIDDLNIVVYCHMSSFADVGNFLT
jgi:hypothetical protein